MLIPLAGGLALALAAAAGWVATRPGAYRYERSVDIGVAADAAWSFVSDFRNFPRWSPWQKLDPSMSTTFAGAPAQVGATYQWSGNKKVGRGRMEVVAVDSAQQLAIALEFFEPFASRADTVWIVEPAAGGCRVRWVMSGRNHFMAKAFDAVMNMEKMLGRDFDEGLGRLKRALESGVAAT